MFYTEPFLGFNNNQEKETFGFIHYHLFCPFRIKYFILSTNVKTPKMYM